MENQRFNLEEMHFVQLNLLNKVSKICDEYKLTYYLAFGSLLGAVRDNKIIAWDDSIDVVMPYADYEKLLSLPQDMFGEGLFLQTYYSDPQYPRCYAKLRDSRTTLIKSNYASLDMNHGIYINIMPLISLSDDLDKRKIQIKDAELLKAIVENKPTSLDKGITHFHSLLLTKIPARVKLAEREKYKSKILTYENKGTNDCFVLAGDLSLKLALPQAWFETALDWEFEGMTVKVPCGWHEWLTLRYGDYKVTPISELQSDKISKFVTLNTEKPYMEYKGKTYCVNGAD